MRRKKSGGESKAESLRRVLFYRSLPLFEAVTVTANERVSSNLVTDKISLYTTENSLEWKLSGFLPLPQSTVSTRRLSAFMFYACTQAAKSGRPVRPLYLHTQVCFGASGYRLFGGCSRVVRNDNHLSKVVEKHLHLRRRLGTNPGRLVASGLDLYLDFFSFLPLFILYYIGQQPTKDKLIIPNSLLSTKEIESHRVFPCKSAFLNPFNSRLLGRKS